MPNLYLFMWRTSTSTDGYKGLGIQSEGLVVLPTSAIIFSRIKPLNFRGTEDR